MTIRRTVVYGAALALVALVSAGVVLAQSQASKQQAPQKAPEREVFCEGLSTGQLCLSGADRAQARRGAEGGLDRSGTSVQQSRGYRHEAVLRPVQAHLL